MAIVDWHIKEQLAATNALIHFLETHGSCGIKQPLLDCRKALEDRDIKAAVRYAHGVKPFGMGSITDSYPTVACEHETPEYVMVVQDALVRNWMVWMSSAEHDKFPIARDMIRAVGRFFR